MKNQWTKMTAAQLAEATREFDQGAGKSVKAPKAELAKHKQATRRTRPGRPPLGDGAARVLFTIHPALLLRLDAFARKHGMKRSKVIALAAKDYMQRHSGGRGSRHDNGTSPRDSWPVPLAASSR